MSSYALCNAEFALAGLESGELCVDYVIFSGIAGIIGINVSGSLSMELSLLGKYFRYLFYEFFVGSMSNDSNGTERCQLCFLIACIDV